MEWVMILGGAVVVIALVYYLGRKGAIAEGEEIALRAANAQSQEKAQELQEEILEDYAAKDREDRLRAEEIVRNRDAAGARKLLQDATDDDSN